MRSKSSPYFTLMLAALLGMITILAQNYSRLSVAIFGSEDAILVLSPVHEFFADQLRNIDEFEITAKVVPVVLWYVVGMLIFTVVQAIAREWRITKQEREVASSSWTKPPGYTPAKYWGSIAFRSAVRSLFGLMAAGSLIILIFIVLPFTADTTETAIGDASMFDKVSRFGTMGLFLTATFWGILEGIKLLRDTRSKQE